jgi:protein-S-isoprenylcysteine O-methyltransferase Ste14
MSPAVTRWPLALYPQAWRERYGPEVASLNDELISAAQTTPLRAGLNLVAGAAAEQWRGLTPRAVLAPVAAAGLATTAIALAAAHARHGGAALEPYFGRPDVGEPLEVVVMFWWALEFVILLRVRESLEWRKTATRKAAPPSFWLTSLLGMTAAEIWLYKAPLIIPAATIGAAQAAFGIGFVIFLAGIGLRGWSARALGRYFTYAILVSPDQPVVASGPYRLVRHPSYTGYLLICAGAGLMSANWAGLAAMTLLPLAITIWFMNIEERALLATLDARYRTYASVHKRLIPFIW